MLDLEFASLIGGLYAGAAGPGSPLKDMASAALRCLDLVSGGRMPKLSTSVPSADRLDALQGFVVREGKALKEFGIVVLPATPDFPHLLLVHHLSVAPLVVLDGVVTWMSPWSDVWVVSGSRLDVADLRRSVSAAACNRFMLAESVCDVVVWIEGKLTSADTVGSRYDLVVQHMEEGSFASVARFHAARHTMSRITKSALRAHAAAAGYDDMAFLDEVLAGTHSGLLFKNETPAAAAKAPEPLPGIEQFPHVVLSRLENGSIECTTKICAPANTQIDGANSHLKILRGILSKPLKLGGPADEHAVDEWAVACHAESPWMYDAIEHMANSAKQGMREGRRWFEFKPVLLVGPPGTGKTWLANRMAALASMPSTTIDASAATSIAPYVGTDSTWRDAQPSEVVKLLATSGIANPIMIVDEIEKSGWLGDKEISAINSLLPMLEQHSAAKFLDSFVKVPIRGDHVNWIFLANSVKGLSQPFLDRVSVVEVGMPDQEQLTTYVIEACRRRGLDEEVAHEIVRIGRATKGLSLRRIGRAIDAAERVSSAPVLH